MSQDRKDEEGAAGTPSGDEDAGDVVDNKELHSLDDDDEGTRQPYKCSFCRRGFPTAQALGGHMNVHRKHRAGRPAAAPTAAATAQASRSCYAEQYATALVTFGGQTQTHPASGSSEATSTMAGVGLFHAERAPQELRLFDHDVGRAKEGGADHGGRRDHCHSKDGGDGDHDDGEELDLELRLGGAGSSNLPF